MLKKLNDRLLESQMWSTWVIERSDDRDVNYVKERFRILGFKENKDFYVEQRLNDTYIYINEKMNLLDATRHVLRRGNAIIATSYLDK